VDPPPSGTNCSAAGYSATNFLFHSGQTTLHDYQSRGATRLAAAIARLHWSLGQ